MRRIPELVCPAGNLPALKTAVDNGADTVYMGLKDATNARNFPRRRHHRGGSGHHGLCP